ncbi:hypothetical protein ES288_D13G135600v1 [Gossypium darwinii]|uniref:HTH CENPB-type domain-containing protein n=1 Tax=Gossypium darwinii TaxID=34276 RepID=A0A5D1ZYC8_GOSDA|nr:hypothetical protein ES288_D13G135600v1 [Gossypium darwinii]
MRKALCKYKNEHPSSSKKDLQQWVQQTFDLSVSQSTISNTFKRSFDYLSNKIKNSNVKRHKSAKYPELEKVLYEWFLQYQEKKMYGDANSEFNFSIGWLEQFKIRHGIKPYKRFGESGLVVMENIKDVLPQTRAKLKIFYWKDIYNMDETGLFYHKVPLWVIGKFANLRCFKHMNIDNLNYHYRANKKAWMTGLLFQDFVCCILESYEKGEINPEKINILDAIHFINVAWNIDVKPTTIVNCFQHCKIRSEEDMPLEQEIVISDLHYRNVMDVKQILNYPSENKSLMESPTDEEIIQGVMDMLADEEQDPENSSVLSHVSRKEVFLAMDTLKNYLIQHKKNIPHLVYALLKVKNEIVFDSHVKK